jgi:hypothetical protein
MFRQISRLAPSRPLDVPRRSVHFNAKDALNRQKSAQAAVKEKESQIVNIAHGDATLWQSKKAGTPVQLFRIMRLAFVTDDKGRFNSRKSRCPYDNSSFENRFSGALAGSQETGQSALYLGSAGNNGLPGQIVAERAFYASKALYPSMVERATRLRSRQDRPGDLEAIRSYFDPGIILPPGFGCIHYEVENSIFYINISDPEILRRLEKPLETARKELLLAYKAESESDAAFLSKLPSDLAAEIVGKSPGEPISMKGALFGSNYAISLTLGNIVLGKGYSLFWDSARGGPLCSKDSLKAH